MNNPELYNEANGLQVIQVLDSLNEFKNKIRWKKTEDTAIDLGSGDGAITALVKNFSGNSYKYFVGSDVNEQMVKFAEKKYASEGISFRVLDIAGEIPNDMKGAFNHVFSFFTLHWVKDQEKGFQNILDLMSENGDCFITFLADSAIFRIYAALAELPKWKTWLKRIDIFVPPYYRTKNAEKIVAKIMENVGFKNIDVTCRRLTNNFDSTQILKNLVQSVEPFCMPNDVFDELFEDYLTVGQEIGELHISDPNVSKKGNITYDFDNCVIYATK